MEFKSVRGNVLTRLKKLDEGEYGALVLAAAGLKRLGLEDRISRYFTVSEIIPAAGQGILAVQGRAGEDFSYLAGFQDSEAAWAATAERAFVRYLDGGCSSPVAAHGQVQGDELYLLGLYYDEETGKYKRGSKKGSVSMAEELGISLARELREACQKENQQVKEQIDMSKGKVWLVGAGPGGSGTFYSKRKGNPEQRRSCGL